MPTKKDISIIIVNYKSLKYLKKSLTELQGFDIIIVDNGEFINKKRINIKKKLIKIAQKNRLKVIRNKKNKGFAKSCNQAAKKTKKRFLLFLNPDCLIKEKSIRKLIKNFNNKPQLAISAPIILKNDGKIQDHSCQNKKGRTIWITGACLMIKKSIFKSIKGFDERFFLYFEDRDLCKKIIKKGYKIERVKKAKAIHFESKSLMTWANRKKHYYKSQNLYIKKHKGKIFELIFRLIRLPVLIYNLYIKNKKAAKVIFMGIIFLCCLTIGLFLSLKPFVVFASILSLILTLCFFQSSNKFLILFIFCLAFLPALNVSSTIDLASSRILILGFFTIWTIKSLIKKKLYIPANSLTLFILLFLIWTLFSIFYTSTSERTIRKILVFLSIFPLYFTIFGMTKNSGKEYLKKIIYAIFFSGIFIAILGISQFLLQFIIGSKTIINAYSSYFAPILWGNNTAQTVQENPSWFFNAGFMDLLRSFATLPDPHMLSYFFAFILPIQLFFIHKEMRLLRKNPNKKTKKMYLLLITIMLSLLTVFLTFSRGGYLGFISGLSFAGLMLFVKKNIIKTKAKTNKKALLNKAISIAMIFIIILATFFTNNPISKRMVSSFDIHEGSNQGRLEIWRKSFYLFLDNPLIGTGLGSYSFEIKPSADYRDPINAHNLYLEFLVEIGAVGTILFLMILFSTIYLQLKIFFSKNDSLYSYLALYLAVSIIWFAGHSFFEIPIYSPVILPLLMINLSITSYLTLKNKHF